jgi:MFS family permease
VLIIPFGAVSGYVQVAMAFLATKHGLTVSDAAMLVAVGMFPHVWKFFWAPVVDMTFNRKRWYMVSVALCAIGITAMSAIPLERSNLLLLHTVILLTNLASTFLGMAIEGLMAHATPPEDQGRVGGWFQAGNLGGSGLGGGAGLWMATGLPSPWMSGAVLGALFLAGASMLRLVPEASRSESRGGVSAAVRHVWSDIWQVVTSRRGFICGLLCLLPIGTGAATSTLATSEVAANWGAKEDTVALVTGVLNGVVSAVGCLVGGFICKGRNSRIVYIFVGLTMALVALAMAYGPRTDTAYAFFSLAYAFVTGLSYAAFTGFVLDAIGKGAAATKYNGFACLSNLPITYMGLILAAVYARTDVLGGARGMLVTEAGAGVLGIVVLIAVAAATRDRTATANRLGL